MENWYEVLEVPRSAGGDEVESAYRRLSDEVRFSAEEGRAARQQRLDEAYAVLGDPERRAAYDQTLPPPTLPTPEPEPAKAEAAEPAEPSPAGMATAEAPPPGEPAEAPAAAGGGGPSNKVLLPLLGVLVALLIGVAIATGIILTRDNGGSSYPLTMSDNDYDLDAMALREADLPQGIKLAQEENFDNAEWAQVVGQDDPDAKKAQLDAQGRVRNHVAFFTWDNPVEHLGKPISITSQSTLFVDEAAAKASANQRCSLLLSDTDPLDEFAVPKLGDQSIGFFLTQQQQNFGTSVDTTVCFRTGRVVHGIIQSGLDGTQDVALSVKLAQRMLTHVNNSFNGVNDPKDAPPPTPSETP